MKLKDIAKQYGVDATRFESFIRQSNFSYREGFSNIILDDDQDIGQVISIYQKYETQLAEENERKRLEEVYKQEALANMLITSGFSFDGYTITKYSGYISGDDAVQIARGYQGLLSRATDVGESLMASLVIIRRKALLELKEAAFALGCNAVIGVDFDYLTLDPQTANSTGGTTYLPYVFGVTANGNAVIIEKNNTHNNIACTDIDAMEYNRGSDAGFGRRARRRIEEPTLSPKTEY
jgi:uncharacterized protein YbjQ (UPF0145 family)